jgi:hypothetical protein
MPRCDSNADWARLKIVDLTTFHAVITCLLLHLTPVACNLHPAHTGDPAFPPLGLAVRIAVGEDAGEYSGL